ncbi:MAG TPA: imidazole glycerol phosphate synthase subunit HisH [Roseiflexaceae bacterium]|nr:imidazole glycerol phosphate synthase subunit HisH [Roseiflexaceae bacterium]HMP39490.1 imidazole glycerol phosphate synthase subunit HisH [Roseiflexaceae bacterium]
MTPSPFFAVVDYGAGNLRSVARALAHVGADMVVTSDPDVVHAAPAVVLPGVGATLDTMQSLQRLGVDQAIRASIQAGKPFLGICVGMQVLCATSEEFGTHPCLDILPGVVRRLPEGQKVPQIGWNQVHYRAHVAHHPLFHGIPAGTDFYFVHSYYCDLSTSDSVAGETDYGLNFPSVLIRENLAAVQFHPEKSGLYGLRLLTNYVAWAQRAA